MAKQRRAKARAKPKARPTKPRTKTKPKAKPKPRPKAKSKPKPKAKAKPKPKHPKLGEYLDNVAANIGLGLDRAIDSMIDMYSYEDHLGLPKLKKEAAGTDAATVIALAAERELVIDEPTATRILAELAGAERYESIEE